MRRSQGNSLIRGPQDVVNSVLNMVSTQFASDPSGKSTYPCSVPHTLTYQIGGKLFSVDPRDFAVPEDPSDTTICSVQNLVATDEPHSGSLYSWSLGVPFFKSNLVVFYYGNLTHPSADPPRIGFLNTVPQNADALYLQAVQNAQAQGHFACTLIISLLVHWHVSHSSMLAKVQDPAPPATATIQVPGTSMAIPPAPTKRGIRITSDSELKQAGGAPTTHSHFLKRFWTPAVIFTIFTALNIVL